MLFVGLDWGGERGKSRGGFDLGMGKKTRLKEGEEKGKKIHETVFF